MKIQSNLFALLQCLLVRDAFGYNSKSFFHSVKKDIAASASPVSLGAVATEMFDETTLPEATLTQENDEGVEFPPPLSPIQRVNRSLEFYRRVLPVLAAYKAKEVELNLKRKLGEDVTKSEEEEMFRELDEWGSQRVADTIVDMKGFYVKSGQVISTRVDLFPEAYTSKLQQLQDGIEPMPFDLVEKVVQQELLDGAPLSELFSSFEEEPLGSASIAQVHKATLLDGRVVAVKLQRPNVEPKLLGDVANLKRISKALAKSLPVDYYTVFCELGDALVNELDFLAEAQAMRKIDLAISHDNDGTLGDKPVTIPLPVGELVSKRVLVMDFCKGVPLNRLSQTMEEKGIQRGSPEAKIAGRRILNSLSLAFGRMIFGAGFIHGDPHPGNIFIGEGGKVSLIDCGQFKALPRAQRVQLAELVLAVAEYQQASAASDLMDAKKRLGGLVRGFGVKFMEGDETNDDLACAVALLLFGDTDIELPGGYSKNELSDKSPLKNVASFPQELVLMGRATVILKGIAKRLDVSLSLAERWMDGCRLTVKAASQPELPLWGKNIIKGDTPELSTSSEKLDEKIRLQHVTSLLKKYIKGKSKRFIERGVQKLPPKAKSQLLKFVVERQERKEAAASAFNKIGRSKNKILDRSMGTARNIPPSLKTQQLKMAEDQPKDADAQGEALKNKYSVQKVPLKSKEELSNANVGESLKKNLSSGLLFKL